MGGNFKIGNIEANRIFVSSTNRKKLIGLFVNFFHELNSKFKLAFNVPLWEENTFNSMVFVSGSGRHFFDTTIPDSTFAEVKPSIGDFDLQVPKETHQQLLMFFGQTVKPSCGGFVLIGFKRSVEQIITLWYIEQLDIVVQIDFELVEFENGIPSEWAQFSHSSDWTDLQLGLKGVCHKYLLRALTSRTLTLKNIRYGKTNREKIEMSTEFAFSVMHGLRRKLILGDDGIYKELATEDSEYTKNIFEIGKQLIDQNLDLSEVPLLWSSQGILQLVKKYWNQPDITIFELGFINTLWGEGAQLLYRDNLSKDFEEKKIMFDFVVGFDYPKEYVDRYYEFKRLIS